MKLQMQIKGTMLWRIKRSIFADYHTNVFDDIGKGDIVANKIAEVFFKLRPWYVDNSWLSLGPIYLLLLHPYKFSDNFSDMDGFQDGGYI